MVNRDKADSKYRKHQEPDEENEFSARGALCGVHLESDIRERRLQRFGEEFRRDVVAFTKSDKGLVLVEEGEHERVLLIAFCNALVLLDFVFHEVREVSSCIDDKALDKHVCTASNCAVEDDVVRIDNGLEEVDFSFHGMRRFGIDQADQKAGRIELCGFDSKRKVAGFGNLFDTVLAVLFLFACARNVDVLLVNLVDEPAIVLVCRVRFFHAARCRDNGWRGYGRES